MNSSAKGDADQHRLAARFVDGPHVSAPDKAEQRLADWLTDLAPEQAAAIGDLVTRFPLARTCLLGIAESSPYLFDLVRADAARLIRLLESDPETYLSELIDRTRLDVVAAAGEADVMQLLRRMKSEAALLVALCDIGGVWPVMRVTAALTDLAVASVQSALRHLLRKEAERGRITPANLDRPEDNSGLIVLAMGKMGAGELNYSSDLHLIGAALLRAGGADLGTCCDDQGAGLRRRRPGGRGAGFGHCAVRLAQASGFCRPCRRARHEAADADLSRPKRDLGGRPQCQDRPRRHPRNRVFRADPAVDRRRPASRVAGAPDAGSPECAGLEPLDHHRGARPADRGL